MELALKSRVFRQVGGPGAHWEPAPTAACRSAFAWFAWAVRGGPGVWKGGFTRWWDGKGGGPPGSTRELEFYRVDSRGHIRFGMPAEIPKLVH